MGKGEVKNIYLSKDLLINILLTDYFLVELAINHAVES